MVRKPSHGFSRAAVSLLAMSIVTGAPLWSPREGGALAQGEASSEHHMPTISARPLSIRDAYYMREFSPRSPMTLASRGEWLAYVVSEPQPSDVGVQTSSSFGKTGVGELISLGRVPAVWVTNLKGGSTIRLSGGRVSSWGPSWSPDGRYLAFFSNRDGFVRLWLWDSHDGDVRRVSEIRAHPATEAEVPEWSPNGRSILIKTVFAASPATEVDHYSSGASKPHVSVVNAWPVDTPRSGGRRLTARNSNSSTCRSDLSLIDVKTGRATVLAKGICPVGYQFDSTGKAVYVLDQKGVLTSDVYLASYRMLAIDLHSKLLNVVDHEITLAAASPIMTCSEQQDSCAVFDPSGQLIVCKMQGKTVQRLRVESGKQWTRAVRAEALIPILLFARRSGVILIADGDSIFSADWARGATRRLVIIPGKVILGLYPWNDRLILALVRDTNTAQMGFESVNTQTGDVSTLWLQDRKIGGTDPRHLVLVEPKADRVLFIAESSDAAPDLWLAARSFKKVRRVTDVNPELREYQFGASEFVHWRDLDGDEVHGTVILPPARYEGKKPYPLVVYPYVGSALGTNDKNTFGGHGGHGAYNLQILATRGYAVFMPNVPATGRPMYDLAQSVLSGINRLVDLHIADPERVAAYGFSGGGYSVIALLTQTRRFRAGIVQSGFSSLMDGYGNLLNPLEGNDYQFLTQWIESYLKLDATPWTDRARYIENSPFFYLDRVAAPVLILHGSADWAVGVFSANELFTALRELHKRASYARYAGAGHSATDLADVADQWERILAWLKEYDGPIKTD